MYPCRESCLSLRQPASQVEVIGLYALDFCLGVFVFNPTSIGGADCDDKGSTQPGDRQSV